MFSLSMMAKQDYDQGGADIDEDLHASQKFSAVQNEDASDT